MSVIIAGDVQGRIKQLYESVATVQCALPHQITAVFQVGDFQTLRDVQDLAHLSVPERYKTLGDFPNFYRAGSVPLPTFFAGGNHEVDQWLAQFPRGGELIPNLHYLGRAGVRELSGMRIGWVSGNYSPRSFARPQPSAFHYLSPQDIQCVREQGEGVEVLLLHEWPSILALEKFLVPLTIRDTATFAYAHRKDFGCLPLAELVADLRPRYVFAGHTHVPFDATFRFGNAETRFVSLGKIGYRRSLCTFDTAQRAITGFYDSKGDLFSILEETERATLEAAFTVLEHEDFAQATQGFRHIREGFFSPEAKAFAEYGLGTALLQQEQRLPGGCSPAVDDAIRHLEASLREFPHADGYLMLGDAFRMKHSARGDAPTAQRAIDAFRNAAELNPAYADVAAKAVRELQGAVH